MSRKNLGYALVVVGVVVLLVSVFADALGLGAQAGYGFKQTVGTVVGAIAAAVGVFLLTRKSAA